MTTASQPATCQGVLELHPKGFGFLRDPARHYAPRPGDPYVSQSLVQKHNLAQGLLLSGPVETGPAIAGDGGGGGGRRQGGRGQNGRRQGGRGQAAKVPAGPRLTSVAEIEEADPTAFRRRDWAELTPVDPTQWIRLETDPDRLTTRVIDLFTPIGKGQRGLIVAPPRSGKTVLLSHIADAVAVNYPDMHLIVLLVDERPEEVTEFRRSVNGEVIASSNDQDTVVHVRTAELVMERAKRLTEQGKDVFVLMDSLTRLARAYNKTAGRGKTMSGGIDSRAMDQPKRLFGAARAFEEGGSLTILGTALIETNSRMDDVIFQEFKGTGNMELVLDRKLAEKRIYPAIDLAASGTRKEERLIAGRVAGADQPDPPQPDADAGHRCDGVDGQAAPQAPDERGLLDVREQVHPIARWPDEAEIMEHAAVVLANAVGVVGFFGSIAVCVWLDQRGKTRRRELEHDERMKAIELGRPLDDATVARTQALGAVGVAVPIATMSAACIGSLFAFMFDESVWRFTTLAVVWAVCGIICLTVLPIVLAKLRA